MHQPNEPQLQSMPQEPEAEQAVLGAALSDHDAAEIAIHRLIVSDFYFEHHQIIFQAILEVSRRAETVDLISVGRELQRTDNWDNAGGGSCLKLLLEAPSSLALGNVEGWAIYVKDAAVKRQIHRSAHKLASMAMNESSLDELVAQMRADADGIQQATNQNTGELVSNLFVPMSDFKPRDDGSYLVDKLLRKGDAALLVAQAKKGKSLLRTELARSVATGGLFLDKFQCEQGGVLLVSLDEKESDEAKRAETIGIRHLSNVRIVTQVNTLSLLGERFTTANGLGFLEAAIDRFSEVDGHPILLVIVDTLPKFASFEDMNDYTSVMPVIQSIVDIAHRKNAAFVMTTHQPWQRSGAIGSTAFSAVVDVLWLLQSKRSGDTMTGTMNVDGRLAPQQVNLKFDQETLRWLATDEISTPKKKEAMSKEAIMKRLKSGDCGNQELERCVTKAIEVSEPTYRRARDQLIEANTIMRHSNGEFAISESVVISSITKDGDDGNSNSNYGESSSSSTTIKGDDDGTDNSPKSSVVMSSVRDSNDDDGNTTSY